MSIQRKQASYEFATVDVFTTERFTGNPLAIVNVPQDLALDQSQKQAIAREFNLSETVFLHEDDGALEGRRLDIFTPTQELPFAGHPVIGAICYIGQIIHKLEEAVETVVLRTKAGTITAEYNSYVDRRSTVAEIPQDVHIHRARVELASVFEAQPQLIESMNIGSPKDVSYPVVSIVKGMTFILIEVPDIQSGLERLQVDRPGISSRAFDLDEAWSPTWVGAYYYAVLPTEKEGLTNVRARMIEPTIGEDPATGSAACTLASYLALQAAGGSTTYKYEVEQGVEMGRRSHITVHVSLDENGTAVKKVLLSGTAVLVTQGSLYV
ncbi:hypothetical protein MMC24_001797 [Lignoscripta atroalba]|nr:hypothetical protein [Lignoscripta atroalba]